MLDTLQSAHDRLDRTSIVAARETTNLAATMKVLESADEESMQTALVHTEETLEALADFLEALATAVKAAGDVGETGNLLGLVEELEPPSSTPTNSPQSTSPEGAGTDRQQDSNPLEQITPLRRLSAPYSILLNLERDLYSSRSRRPFRLRKLKEIWGDLIRLGGAHPNEGLGARLSRISEHVEEAVAGRDAANPWSRDVVREVRSLATRAQTIRDWDRAELERREQRDWVERVRSWVETLEEEPDSAAQLAEMLTRFLTDRPREGSDEIIALLERMTEIETLPPDLEAEAQRALSEYD